MRTPKRSRFLRLVFATLAFAGVPLWAMAYPIQTNEYYGSVCSLIQSASSGWQSEVTSEGTLLKPMGSSSSGTFVCPAVMTTNLSSFYVTNIAFSIDAYAPGSGAITPSCQGVIDTGNHALYIMPGMGPDTSNYANIDRAYLICTIPNTSNANVRGFKAFLSYFQ
jgi:hypothetical protein